MAVNLPNVELAIVEQAKVVDYLLALDHPEGASKAEFFTQCGFSAPQWEVLANALIDHARVHPVASTSPSKFGVKYRIDGPVSCPDGRSPSIRAVWIINAGSEV